MPRSRVLSFMSQWGSGARSASNDRENTPSPVRKASPPAASPAILAKPTLVETSPTRRADRDDKGQPTSTVTPSRARGDARVKPRAENTVPNSEPVQVDASRDTPPELAPIFSFLSSHGNKLYQEGYFLKLHDLDTRGRPSPERAWVECFAQLVGTVLSLWDAAALDAAGEDGEVMPTFINLSDASIKMIESLPMNGAKGGNLQNVLSVSTAANNRYLLHFNSLSSLTQWTAGIRLAMFEHATLQEAYTGSLIAGKGRFLNNISTIMERHKFVYEDWARVRFGAGTPWRRCWCVISPPDEKEFAKAMKEQKKASPYERIKLPKGDIKFYASRKVTKKTRPIATIADAYAAYAIYPQSKPLIDQSTLVKLEGLVTIHTAPETTTEGFVFIMPEVHPAVSGFEMMLRFLFPVFDTFCLYGRPTRLVADSLDQRGLMFAMPRDRRYGYLDTLDVSGLIHTKGSQAWSERQWRREMKKLTAQRMLNQTESSPRNSQTLTNRRSMYSKLSSPQASGVRFDEGGAAQTSPLGPARADINRSMSPPVHSPTSPHKRSVSEAQGYKRHIAENSSRLSQDSFTRDLDDVPPQPPKHASRPYGPGNLERINSGTEVPTSFQGGIPTQNLPPLQPVGSPPPMQHNAYGRPSVQPALAPEIRQAYTNVDRETLLQMRDAANPRASPDHEWSAEAEMRQRNTVANSSRSDTEVPTDPSQGCVNDAVGHSPTMYQANEMAAPTEILANSSNYRSTSSHNTSSAPEQVFASLARKSLEILASRRSLDEQSVDISRKPVPPTAPQSRETESRSSTMLSSPNSWAEEAVDEAALDLVLEQNSRSNTMTSTAAYHASAMHADSNPQVREKTRPGKLKVVGDPNYHPANKPPSDAARPDLSLDTKSAALSNVDIPKIDFGPTFSLNPAIRPSTSGTNPSQQEQETGTRSRPGSADRLQTFGLQHGARHNKTTSASRMSPLSNRESPSPIGVANSTPWRPSSAVSAVLQGDSGRLTPEQWVLQRAAHASQPQHAPPRKPVPLGLHIRQNSSNVQGEIGLDQSGAKTPPPFVARHPSGDWSQGRTTPPSRPHSRNASLHLNQYNQAVTPPLNLTAREQMHIARSTGTPMLGYTSDAQRKGSEQYAPGLLGALAAREKERQQTSPQIQGNAVLQQSILARQQHQQAAQAEKDYHAAMLQTQYQAQMQQHLVQQQMQLTHRQSQLLQQSPTIDPNWPLQQQHVQYQEMARPGSAHRTMASSHYNLQVSEHGTRPAYSHERQGSIVAQQPGGAQQWQQQQSRP